MTDEDPGYNRKDDSAPPEGLPLTEIIILAFLAVFVVLALVLMGWGFYWVVMRIFG